MYGSGSGFDNFEILRQNLGGSADNFEDVGSSRSNDLRPIEEIPHPYQQVFAEYPNFNPIQSKILDDVFYTDQSLVLSAPTGSGKTAIFEIAIVRLLIAFEQTQFLQKLKVVFICPMKALCEERLGDWHKKFSKFGVNCISVTGDSDIFDFQSLLNYNLIITTPEKWDSLTRKWRENLTFFQSIKLFMIDEVHLLNEERRGSTLEAIVCRMKTIEESVKPQQILEDYLNHKIRFIAVSATVANIEDVAEWIGKPSDAKSYKFSDDFRPVKLNKIVFGYSVPPKSTPFKFDLALNYKLNSLIKQYSHGRPTLIFCSTRKMVEMTARHIMQNLTINLKEEQNQRLVEAASRITDSKVKEMLIHGVGYHHGGMLPETRHAIENLFRNSELPILVTTSTLSMGVNLPAHLVIIKSTKCYHNHGFNDYTETALLQMIGRAGRPQFDTEATVLILTTANDKKKFEKMIGGIEPIESNLHRHLIEHLNAEVVLQTITSVDVALRWLTLTFLYIRAKKNPRHYGLTSSDPDFLDRKLLDMCQIELNKLHKTGMLTIDQDALLKATPVGAAMAKYYLGFETMKLFTEINGGEILQQILALVSKCSEFSETYLRVDDKKCLNLLNKCRDRQTIRFPLNGKIKTVDMKINCIIQAVLGCLNIGEHSILTEALTIMRKGERITKCLIEYLESKEKCFQALLNTIILAKCFHVKLWENSPHVCKQLPGIGNAMSSQLVNAGKTSFELVAQCDAREIEMLLNKKPPTGSKLLEVIHHLPKYDMTMKVQHKNQLKLVIVLKNASELEKSCSVNFNSLMYLLVGDSFNNILLYEKYSHSYFIENRNVVRFINIQEESAEFVEAQFISEDWVGFDCSTKYELISKTMKTPKTCKSNGKRPKTPNKKSPDSDPYMQTFMQKFLQWKTEKNFPSTPMKTANEKSDGKIIIHSNIILNKNDDIDKLKNEKAIVRKFEFTPKRLNHDKMELPSSETVEPASKKICPDEKSKNISKVTWRSPLTYSPSVKFSPKIKYNSNHKESLSTSSLITKPSSFTRQPLSKSQKKVIFPLSDKAHADSSLDESTEYRNNILEKVGDFASVSFLEDFGVISPPERQNRLSHVKTANQHYHQLLSQSDQQKFSAGSDSTALTSDSYTPEHNKRNLNIINAEVQKTPRICDTFSNRSPYFRQDLAPKEANGVFSQTPTLKRLRQNTENFSCVSSVAQNSQKDRKLMGSSGTQFEFETNEESENNQRIDDPFDDSLSSIMNVCRTPSEVFDNQYKDPFDSEISECWDSGWNSPNDNNVKIREELEVQNDPFDSNYQNMGHQMSPNVNMPNIFQERDQNLSPLMPSNPYQNHYQTDLSHDNKIRKELEVQNDPFDSNYQSMGYQMSPNVNMPNIFQECSQNQTRFLSPLRPYQNRYQTDLSHDRETFTPLRNYYNHYDFDRTQPIHPMMPSYQHCCHSPRRNAFDFSQRRIDDDLDDGYLYIRRVMETEPSPFGQRNAPYYPTPTRNFDIFEARRENDDISDRVCYNGSPVSYGGRGSELSQLRGSNYSSSYHPSQRKFYGKNYLMQKFLNSVRLQQQYNSHHFP